VGELQMNRTRWVVFVAASSALLLIVVRFIASDGAHWATPTRAPEIGVAVTTADTSPQAEFEVSARENEPTSIGTKFMCSVFVHDERGVPIERAEIAGLGGSGLFVLGATNSEGILEFEPHSGSASTDEEIVVSASSFATSYLPAWPDPGQRVDVELAAEGWIAGRAVMGRSGSPVAGARVTAVPLDVHFGGDASTAAARRCAHVNATSTDQNGEFRLNGLREGETYRIEAIRGNAAVDPRDLGARITATTANVEIRLGSVWGACLEFTCDDRDYLTAFYQKPDASISHSSTLQRSFLEGPDLSMQFAGVPRAREGGTCLLLLFVDHAPEQQASRSVHYEGTIPGFETFDLEVRLEPIDGGSFVTTRVPLVPNSEGSGVLVLELEGAQSGFVAEHGARGRLTLTGGPEGQSISFPVNWSDGDTKCRLPRVPAGTYRWQLSTEGAWLQIDSDSRSGSLEGASSLTIRADGELRVPIPLPAVSYVQFECMSAHGPVTPVLQLANGTFGSRSAPVTKLQSIPCRRASELVGPLPVGPYSVMVSHPAPLPEGPHEFELSAGAIHVEVIVL
jgi:hypothetical protein